jgi:protein-disulfide isomerase
MKNEPKANSGVPLIIIGLVLVAVVAGGYFFYNASAGTKPVVKAPTANGNGNRTAAPVNAPPGAQPPNMLGSPTAAVTVEEFADFQCPSCGATHPAMKEIQQIYGSRIKFIFRQFPLQMHDKAYDAAVAAEAAGMQGSDKFWAMHNLLYTNQKSWSVDPNYRQVFAGYAQQIGLDVAKFQTDSLGLPAKNRVDADKARGQALAVSSTPTVLVNGQSIPYPEMNVQGMRQFIDAELQRVQGQGPAAQTPAAPANSSATTNSSNSTGNSNK